MSLVKNSTWNLVGYILPTLIAIPALGYLARALGVERFGFFTLAMAIVGYASIFDAGLTRAVIREVSIYRSNIVEKNKIISSSSIIVFVLGCIGALLIYFFSSDIVTLLKVSNSYALEVESSLDILLLSVPVFLLNQIWLAILEGEERFSSLNIQKCLTSSLVSGMPALFVMVGKFEPLIGATYGLLFSRVASLVLSYIFNSNQLRNAWCWVSLVTISRLVRFGGWITVSNIISPLMSYFDRFIISNITGAGVVAYYTVPSEVISRIGVIPFAMSRAIFPKLSADVSKEEKHRNKILGYIIICTCCLPVVLGLFFFSEYLLVMWMGAEYSGVPATILRILLVGFFFNSLAQVPFASIQGRGDARITAYLHLGELLPYLVLLFVLVGKYSVLGAAIAWSIRVFVDFLLLFYLDSTSN